MVKGNGLNILAIIEDDILKEDVERLKKFNVERLKKFNEEAGRLELGEILINSDYEDYDY